jgi:hypothetical protein
MSSPIAPRSESELVHRAARSPGAEAKGPDKTEASEPFREVLGRLGREVDRGERLVEHAIRGARTADAGQLIALQAGIYRYTEAVELCSKVVDRVGAAVRTTLQNQG